MTLRVTIEIVPYGNEDQKYEIYRMNIVNNGLIRDEGFGHQICKYEYSLLKPLPPILGGGFDVETQGTIKEHDRRDGAIDLIRKVLKSLKRKGF